MSHTFVKRLLVVVGVFFFCVESEAPAQQATPLAVDDQIKSSQKPTAKHTCRTRPTDVPQRHRLSDLPVGVFDSGTGGLTVLEQILDIDTFCNDTKAFVPEGDSKPDFINERFVFLADQANMPYGNYPAVGKTNLLQELIVQDVRFLTGTNGCPSAWFGKAEPAKPAVKVIVVACNTATAYGKEAIETFLDEQGFDVEVVGVIEAGARDALEIFSDGEAGTIGVIATKGTALSGAYPAAIRALAAREGPFGPINIVQQGAYGLAGAIDGDPSFINRSVDSHRTRNDYRGPSVVCSSAPIDGALLRRYDFDFSDFAVLYDGDARTPSNVQLNSAENYIAYYVVALAEGIRKSLSPRPLRTVILGCTHFPFYSDVFRRELTRLYNYKENGRYVYRSVLVPEVKLIDPAFCTAEELHAVLTRNSKHRRTIAAASDTTRAAFFITVPDRNDPTLGLTPQGWFTYEYKYGRSEGVRWSDVRAVPFGRSNVRPEVMRRLARQVPQVRELLDDFHQNNAKAGSRQAVSSDGN